MNIVYIALGSNLGDRKYYLTRAVDEIEKRIGEIISLSAFYETEPWGFISRYPFLNAVLIEKDLGRKVKSHGSYQDRCIDIDLLFFNTEILKNDRLELPHPLLQERRFVLEPLVEIAPDLYHPILHKTIKDIWQEFLSVSK